VTKAHEIVQFLPSLRAREDGVADYARLLAGALRDQAGIASRWLVGDPVDLAPDAGDRYGESAMQLKSRSPEQVAAALRALCGTADGTARRTVLLHYANYGYASRGCPQWLVEGLARWKAGDTRARLAVMYHEVYASGPPWRSAFWLAPLQRRLAERLLALADQAITSTELYRRMLAAPGGRPTKPILVVPVFSTIGEPADDMPWDARRPWLAVLGRAGTEARAYERQRAALASMTQALQLDEIVDIGARSRPVPAKLGGVRVRATGYLPREEVSKLLRSCRAGFLDYPSDVLGKSTVFAAYCAHGVVPLVTRLRGAGLDGLREGAHFLVARADAGGAAASPQSLAKVSRTVAAWYRDHNLAAQAAALSGMLDRCSSG